MERFLVSGIICFLHIGYVLSQGIRGNENVTIAVNVSHIYAKLGDRVAMNCFGDTSEIIPYVSNIISWYQDKEKVNPKQDGTIHRVTNGFFVLENIDGSKYQMTADDDTVTNTYNFPLVIKNVSDEDYGDWLCRVQKPTAANYTSQKKVRLEIIRDIEEIEIHLEGDSGAISKVPYNKSMEAAPVKAGSSIQVTCKTKGSNPKPTMFLVYNSEELSPLPNVKDAGPADKRIPRITADFTVAQEIAGANNAIQKLVCRAQVEGFPAHEAGLKLQVKASKVLFNCLNSTAVKGNKQRTLTCMLKFKEGPGLTCDNVFWRIDKTGTMFTPKPTKVDRKNVKDFGITEAECKMERDQVKTRLTFFDIYDIHLESETTFTIGAKIDGSNPATHEVQFIKGEDTSTASVISPVSVIFCLVLTLLSRKVSK